MDKSNELNSSMKLTEGHSRRQPMTETPYMGGPTGKERNPKDFDSFIRIPAL